MKNILVIDDGWNCTFPVFQATEEEFAQIFPDDEDIEFSDEVYERLGKAGWKTSWLPCGSDLSGNQKSMVCTARYLSASSKKRPYFPPTRRERDWDHMYINEAQRRLYPRTATTDDRNIISEMEAVGLVKGKKSGARPVMKKSRNESSLVAIGKEALEREATRARKMLRGKVASTVWRHSEREVGIEFTDGTRLDTAQPYTRGVLLARVARIHKRFRTPIAKSFQPARRASNQGSINTMSPDTHTDFGLGLFASTPIAPYETEPGGASSRAGCWLASGELRIIDPVSLRARVDLAVITPATLLTGLMLLRGEPVGYVMAFSLLVLEAMLAPLIVAQTVSQLSAGVSFTPGQIIGPMIGFAVLAVLAVWFLSTLLRGIPEGSQAPGRRLNPTTIQ